MTEKMCSVMLLIIKTHRKPFLRIFEIHIVLGIKKLRNDHLLVYLVLATLISLCLW